MQKLSATPMLARSQPSERGCAPTCHVQGSLGDHVFPPLGDRTPGFSTLQHLPLVAGIRP
eukprot:6189316-Pleurochrysis_carterae.AAC.2